MLCSPGSSQFSKMTHKKKYSHEVQYSHKPITQTWMQSQGQIDEDVEENEDYQKMGQVKEDLESIEVTTVMVKNDKAVKKDAK